jgi:hypothetical protein
MANPQMRCDSSWLELPSREDRLAAMPHRLASAVRDADDAGWSGYRRSNPQMVVALSQCLADGMPLPRPLSASLKATLRAGDKLHFLSAGSSKELVNFLCRFPHVAVHLFATLGRGAVDRWPSRRKLAQQTQRRWTDEREKATAGLCREVFFGVPGLSDLYSSDDPELRALGQYLGSKARADRFAERHGLMRLLRKRENGSWTGKQSVKILRDVYRSLCLQQGRFVPDSQLSEISCVPLPSSHDGKSSGTLAGNSLRALLRRCTGVSVRQTFLELCETGELPRVWKRQAITPTTSSGVELDSWSEVRWWEGFEASKRQLPDEHPARRSAPVKHPMIGASGLTGDAAVGGVFIEVLRHSLAALASGHSRDAQNYAKKLGRRREAYKQEGIDCLYVEPQTLANAEGLSRHYSELFERVGGRSADVAVVPSSLMPPGHWYDLEKRIEGIREVITASGGSPGAVPPLRVLVKHGKGGLEAYLHRYNGAPRVQTELAQAGLLFVRARRIRAVPTTAAHVAAAVTFHRKILLDERSRVQRGAVEKVFGPHALAFLEHVCQTEDACATIEDMLYQERV